MDMKFKTTKEYKKLKKEFIIMNFVFVFIYFAILIGSGLCIVIIICSLNVGDIIGVLGYFFCLILFVLLLPFVIMEHISEVKEFRVTVLREQLLSLENIIGGLGKGTMLRPVRRGDDKIE
uniref:Plectrovirus spv1-r8a2b orf 6 transmembrane protein n=1 Tax=Spiroplasma citri TaxID=2133 RepID=Q14Q00_SPICI|nr:plectrovirus spv1-r8a2b orf 6 transmembrane protein [Spiroplasma citri]